MSLVSDERWAELEALPAKIAGGLTSDQQENMRTWIAALRSGQYRQGTGTLRWPDEDGDRFCCLGVACEVLGASWDGGYYDGSGTFLPSTIASKLGFKNESPRLTKALTCVAANDGMGWSFARIADALEARYLTGAAS